MGEAASIVFDIGGTKTRVGIVGEGELGATDVFSTSQSPEEGLTNIIESAERLVRDAHVAAVVGGAPGTIKDGVLVSANNLPLWKNVLVASRIGGVFDASVALFNDAELVGLGEYFYGAGKGDRDILYVTVSTGVGGAHIVDGKINRGKYNAEIGHQMVNHAELESLISGTAIEKKYGIHPKELSDEKILNELADILAQGLYDNVLHWSPESIVLGGSMITGENAIPVERVQSTLSKLIKKYYPEAPRIKKAVLGDYGGLYGGMGYLQTR